MSFHITEDQDSRRITPAVQWLIAINVAIYFLQLTLLGGATTREALGFSLHDLADRPWSVVTYMFVHDGFWHLAMNVYGLWVFGPRFERARISGAFTRYFLL